MICPIRSLDEARAAFAQPGPVSIEAEAGLAGIGWWREMLTILKAEFPGRAFTAVLDCGDRTGLALAAIRDGIPCIRVDARPDVLAKIQAIAAQSATTILTRPHPHQEQ